MKVVAQPVWRDDEEYLVLLTVSLIHSPVPDFGSFRLQFIPDAANVRDQHRRAILRRISAIDGKTHANAIAFKNDCRGRLVEPLDFGHAEMLPIPLGCGVEIRDR